MLRVWRTVSQQTMAQWFLTMQGLCSMTIRMRRLNRRLMRTLLRSLCSKISRALTVGRLMVVEVMTVAVAVA